MRKVKPKQRNKQTISLEMYGAQLADAVDLKRRRAALWALFRIFEP